MNTRVATAVTAGVAALVLAACGQGPQQAQDQGSNSSAPTSQQPAPSSASSASSSSSSSSAPSVGAASSSSHETHSAAGTSGAAAARCVVAHLTVSLARAEGAAGSTYDTVRLTNIGTTTCSLDGYPGVSLVGHGNGTQVGSAATRDASSHPATVTIGRGRSTTFVLRVVQAGNYPRSACSPVPADGLRIYPPGSTAALYLPLKAVTGCARTSVHLLTVRPVGAAA